MDVKVEEILRRLLPSSPKQKFPSDRSSYHVELLEGEPSSVALKLNRASSSQFVNIEFRNYIRKARSSENDDRLEDFIDWHSEVSEHIWRLEFVPDEVKKYVRIAEVSVATILAFLLLTMQWQQLEKGSPIHWAVTWGLRQALPMDTAPQPQLGMIYYPLRNMLGQEAQSLLDILKKLAVLEIRYK